MAFREHWTNNRNDAFSLPNTNWRSAATLEDYWDSIYTGSQVLLLRRLSNDYSDGNKYGKKAIGLDNQNNNFERALRF